MIHKQLSYLLLIDIIPITISLVRLLSYLSYFRADRSLNILVWISVSNFKRWLLYCVESTLRYTHCQVLIFSYSRAVLSLAIIVSDYVCVRPVLRFLFFIAKNFDPTRAVEQSSLTFCYVSYAYLWRYTRSVISWLYPLKISIALSYFDVLFYVCVMQVWALSPTRIIYALISWHLIETKICDLSCAFVRHSQTSVKMIRLVSELYLITRQMTDIHYVVARGSSQIPHQGL